MIPSRRDQATAQAYSQTRRTIGPVSHLAAVDTTTTVLEALTTRLVLLAFAISAVIVLTVVA